MNDAPRDFATEHDDRDPAAWPEPDEIGLARRRRRARQFQVRSLMLAVLAAAAWVGFLELPGAAAMVGGALVWGLLVVAIVLGAMALGWIGFGLFAVFDWMLGRPPMGRSDRKPKPVDDWWA